MIFHKKGEAITTTPVYCGKEDTINVVSRENIYYFTESNCKVEDFNLEYVIDENLKAPLNEDTVIGKAKLYKDGQVLGEFDLYPEKNIEKENLFTFYMKNVLKTTIR
jgi:D-alanyl-D-alanine carboxypeptidase